MLTETIIESLGPNELLYKSMVVRERRQPSAS